jgi:hypothetical protein
VLAAAGDGEASSLHSGNPEGRDGLLRVIEGVRGEGVMGPAAFLAERHEPGVPQGLKVKREERLTAVECALQVAHTLLALPEQVENAEAADIGEGVEERGVALEALGGGGQDGGGHTSTYLDGLMYARGAARVRY